MNMHEQIMTDLQKLVADNDADIITPASLAQAIQARYASRNIEPHIAYASLEHLKQMARKVLAGHYDAEGEQSSAYQGELFSGRLQARYPLPRGRDREPAYKVLEALTPSEVKWNIASLRRSANARMMHADALEAWDQDRQRSRRRRRKGGGHD